MRLVNASIVMTLAGYYFVSVFFVVLGAIGCGQKSFKLLWRCQQLLSGFLAKGHLPRLSLQSRRSLMIRVIMK